MTFFSPPRALVLATLAAMLPGCAGAGPPVPAGLASPPAIAMGLMRRARGADDGLPATLRVALRAPAPVPGLDPVPDLDPARVAAPPRGPGRRLRALPAAWDVAVVRLTHPTLLGAPRTRTLARDVDLVARGPGAYGATGAFGGPLRPATGYGLDVELWEGAVATGRLVATRTEPLDLVGGVNEVVVALDVLADPLALTGAAPAGATWGDAVALAGTGLAGGASAASLGGVAADAGASTPTSLAVVVPPVAPGTHAWDVTVAGRGLRLPGFVVETPPTGSATPLAAVDARQADPAVLAVPGGFLAAWADGRLGPKTSLAARAFGPTGTPSGAEAMVATATTAAFTRPHLARDPGRDRALVVWEAGPTSLRAGFAAGTAPVAGAFDLTTGGGLRAGPRVSYAPAHDAYLVAYREASDVVVQAVPGAGAPAGPVQVVASSGATTEPDLAYAPAPDRHLVVWTARGDGVRGRLLDGLGAPLGPAFDVAVAPGVGQDQPTVAADPAGGFLVAWAAASTPPAIKARRVAADGTLGAVTTVAAPAGGVGRPRLAYASWHGRFLLAFEAGGADRDVYGAYLAPDATPWGVPFAIATGPGDQAQPEVAAGDAASRALVAWNDQAGSARRVGGRRVR